ncbi:MAG: ABC transporter ATP-binding protein [Phycisphaerae bacterium]|nr:ABC transporter ATP-binding protein [Phycisphaerae bacterium]
MTAPDVIIEQLHVAAAGRTILSIDHLAIERGEVLAVLGPNGAGKTTLLKTCLGLRRPTSGRVTILEQPVTQLGSAALTRLRRHIGYIPQELAAHSQMPLTLREVVAIGRTGIAGLLRPLRHEDWEIIDEGIARLGLEPLRDEPYAHLSGGEQRKTLIARAMVQQPQILMLDEPTAHLDLGWREHIVSTLDQLYEQARPTLILVCHELEVLPACCRRIVLLQDGRVLDQGTPEEVLTPERVAELYGPGLRVLHESNRHAVIPFEGGRG